MEPRNASILRLLKVRLRELRFHQKVSELLVDLGAICFPTFEGNRGPEYKLWHLAERAGFALTTVGRIWGDH